MTELQWFGVRCAACGLALGLIIGKRWFSGPTSREVSLRELFRMLLEKVRGER
jgi:hypothetical protein